MGIAITPKIQFTRDTNGACYLQAQNADNIKFEGVGFISGNGQLSFGATNAVDNYSQITYSSNNDEENELILANRNGMNVSISGEKANVSCLGGNAERTIEINGKNCNVDLSNAGGSQVVTSNKDARYNHIELGTGNDYYTDEGRFNHVGDKGGANQFETTSTSHGAVIVAGAGSDTFAIGGACGIIDGGNGTNTFITSMKDKNDTSETQDITIEGSFKNIIIGGNGNDTFIDKGQSNIFFGYGGGDTVDLQGINGIADLRQNTDETTGKFASSAINSFAFAQTKVIWVDTNGDGQKEAKEVTYDIYEKMLANKWTLADFYEYAEDITASEIDPITDHDVIDSATLAKLQLLLDNENLK